MLLAELAAEMSSYCVEFGPSRRSNDASGATVIRSPRKVTPNFIAIIM